MSKFTEEKRQGLIALYGATSMNKANHHWEVLAKHHGLIQGVFIPDSHDWPDRIDLTKEVPKMEEGYYWVKLAGGKDLQVEYWNGEGFEDWNGERLGEEDIEYIHEERIIPPEHKNP